MPAGIAVREAWQLGTDRLAALPTARRDAELLLLRALRRDRAWLLTHSHAEISHGDRAQYEAWIARRERHEPIQYILGEQEFFGLVFRVTPDVLIPRPETEHLVEALLQRLPSGEPVRIADIGTGSGAIAVALARHLPQAEIAALDISPAALAIARGNAERHGVAARIRWVQSDLLSAVSGETFDAIVSNPPYIAESDLLEPQVRDFEPHQALFAGPTGLEVYRRLIPQAAGALVPGGWLLLEIGHGQRQAVAEQLSAWRDLDFVSDLQGIPRVAIARRGIRQ